MNRRIVHLAVYEALADWEHGHLIARLNSPRWQREPGTHAVATVSETGEPVTTMGGVRIVPDVALADLDPAASAMLVLPGADSWDEGQNGGFAQAARRFLEDGVPVAAICGGTFGLAREGLLDERDHTSNAPAYLEATGYAGSAHYRDGPVVTDGDLITAGATASLEFAKEALARLDVFEPEVLDAWYGLFSTGDARFFATLAAAEPEAEARR
jgi:putative intracellular protease/amidase